MQSGALPPFPPGLPPPPFPPTPNAATTPTAAPQPPTAPVVHPALHAVASDKEDGEVSDGSDGDMASRSRKIQPAPPRSAPQPARPISRFQDTYNPDRPSAGHSAVKESVRKPSQPSTTTQKEPAETQQRREEAKQFVRLLNSNQIGYRALAGENLDKALLRELYSSLNLPSEPEPISPLGSTRSAAMSAQPTGELASNTHTHPTKSVPAISTKVTAPAAASAPSPVDRKDYIARLQAARLAAKQPSTTKSSPQQQTPPATTAAPLAAVKTPQETMTPTKKSTVTEEQKARNTEVIRQRLEQLRAKNKQSLPSRPNTSGTNTPVSQSQASSFGGIPGLFMNAPSSSSNGVAAPKSIPPPSSHKASDTETSTPRGSVTPYTRPLGQSPYSYHEESMIIQVSDDESNGSDMDIDDDQAPSNPPVARQGPGSIPGLPRRPAQAETVSSIMSTSGPQTPSSSARTGEMTSKEKELAAMKLTLKKKLAEQKRVREAAAAAATPATPKTLPPKPPSQSTNTEKVSLPQKAASPSLKRNQPGSSENNNNPVDRKRRRRTEIQEQLPSLDDEIANNEAEMARIAKDLERLKANNERILQDKHRLTKELEELGIDTEGMSHAELRATKHDIECAISPNLEDTPQVVATTFQTLTNGERPSASDVIERMTSIEDQSKTESSLAHRQTGQYALLPGIGQASQAPKTGIQAHVPSTKALAPPESVLKERNDPIATPTAVETRGSATPMDDDEDFYSPPPQPFVDGQNEITPAPIPHVEAETGGEVSTSLSEEGEVDMSESSDDEEDEYEPEDPQQSQGLQGSHESQVVKESQAPAPDSPSESAEDEGVYEPPDVDEQMADKQIDSTADSPNQVEAGDDAMDIASSSDEDSDESDSDSEQESSPEPEMEQAHATDRVQQSANAADDLAPELQVTPAFELAPVEPAAEAVRRYSHKKFR
jgi:archaellum component FlaC